MKLTGRCFVLKMSDFSFESEKYLHLLYYPLMGKDALVVYQILFSVSDQMDSLEQSLLISLSRLSEAKYDKALRTLEEFQLIRTYFDGIQNTWTYHVYAPMNAKLFLSHDTFSRYFLNEMGSKYFDQIKLLFHKDFKLSDSIVEVTKPFDTDRIQSWSNDKEAALNKLKYSKEDQLPSTFNHDVFLNGLDQIFPMRLRTEKNLKRIAQLATIHGIDEKEMRQLVQRSTNPKTKVFNFETLRNLVYKNFKQKPFKDPYKMAPVQFLAMKQDGKPVAFADKKMIEEISLGYKLPNEVMNVLIEYSLVQTGQVFSKSFVQKVAASWSRLHIETKEQALKQIQEPVQKSKSIPDWYGQTQVEKPDDDLLQQALERQRRLKEGN